MHEREMAVSGLKPDGTWANRDPWRCPLCGGDEVYRVADNPKMIVKQCEGADDCGALGVVSKGKSSWWYHDWRRPEDMAPRWLEQVLEAVRS